MTDTKRILFLTDEAIDEDRLWLIHDLRRQYDDFRGEYETTISYNPAAALQHQIDAVYVLGDSMFVHIEELKQQRPDLIIFGLKFQSPDENRPNIIRQNIDTAYRRLIDHQGLDLVGSFASTYEKEDFGFIMTDTCGIRPANSRASIIEACIETLQLHMQREHYKAHMIQVARTETLIEREQRRDVEALLRNTEKWERLALFPSYWQQETDASLDSGDYGMVAKRTPIGTLVTTDKSNKQQPSANDIAFIVGGALKQHRQTIGGITNGGEVSAEAGLAHKILEAHPQFEYVVHSPVFLPTGRYLPSFDEHTVMDSIEGGATILNFDMYGTMIMLKNANEMQNVLASNQIYRTKGDIYDLVYAHLQSGYEGKTGSVEAAIQELDIDKNSRILDLCCGTGSSAASLMSMGYHNIDIADGSPSMLREAEQRLGIEGYLAQLEDTSELPQKHYDVVTMRQAFNYVSHDALHNVFRNVSRLLKPDGLFIFNSFACLPDTVMRRKTAHEIGNMSVVSAEINNITEDRIIHAQRSEIIDMDKQIWSPVLDVTEFYQHQPNAVERALRDTLFRPERRENDKSICYIARAPSPLRLVAG